MDPITILASIYELGKLIYGKAEEVKANHEQCKRLSTRVKAVLSATQGLDRLTASQQYTDGLLVLQKCLEACLGFIEEFGVKKRWYKKVLQTGSSKEKFEELNDRLGKANADLNLGLAAQHLFNREQDKADQERDYAAIVEQQGEIIRLNQVHNQALQELKIEQKEGQEILQRQLLSMRGKIEALNIKKEPKPPLEQHLLIPYYEISFDKKIGAGAYCNVYLGKWCEQLVAIKSLEGSLEARELEEFIREASIMGRLHNPNIVQLYGACIEPANPCLIMEYLEEGSLATYLDKKTFNSTEQKEVALDIARGLLYLHKQGILHRDLKSANVLLNTKKQAKLADFGLAKMKQICSIKSIKKYSEAIEWQAPECLERNPTYSEASDIYSFGMILWEIVTGKKPYERFGKGSAGFAGKVIEHVLTGGREDIPANMPQVLKEIISACWNANPRQRPVLFDVIQQLKQYQPVPSLSAEEHYHLGIQHQAIAEKSGAFPDKAASEFREAYSEYKQSADDGFAKALTNIGFFCLKGLGGLKQNAVDAYQYFAQAAEKGDARAMANAAFLLERGKGVAQDLIKAKNWYQKAAEAFKGKDAVRENEALQNYQRLERTTGVEIGTGKESVSSSSISSSM